MADFEHYLDQIRTLTRDVFIPLEAQMEAECDVPQAAMKAIREAGLSGISIPTDYGGMAGRRNSRCA